MLMTLTLNGAKTELLYFILTEIDYSILALHKNYSIPQKTQLSFWVFSLSAGLLAPIKLITL